MSLRHSELPCPLYDQGGLGEGGCGGGGGVLFTPLSQPSQSYLHSVDHRCSCAATAVAASSISMRMPDRTKVQIKHLFWGVPCAELTFVRGIFQYNSCRGFVSGLSRKFGLQVLFSFTDL